MRCFSIIRLKTCEIPYLPATFLFINYGVSLCWCILNGVLMICKVALNYLIAVCIRPIKIIANSRHTTGLGDENGMLVKNMSGTLGSQVRSQIYSYCACFQINCFWKNICVYSSILSALFLVYMWNFFVWNVWDLRVGTNVHMIECRYTHMHINFICS